MLLFLLCSYIVFSNPCIPLSASGCPWAPGGRETSSSHPGSENPSLEGKIRLSGGVPGPRPRSCLRRERRKVIFSPCWLPTSCCRGADGSWLHRCHRRYCQLRASRAGRGRSRPQPADKTYLRKIYTGPIQGHVDLLELVWRRGSN